MARSDALLRISKTLIAKRNDLRKRIGMDLEEIAPRSSSSVGDSAEAAFAAGGVEIASQLAALETKELASIEMALQRIKQGMYGTCYGCEMKIPVARLTALPYSVLCIGCRRESEKDASWMEDRLAVGSFLRMNDGQHDPDFSVAELELNLS